MPWSNSLCGICSRKQSGNSVCFNVLALAGDIAVVARLFLVFDNLPDKLLWMWEQAVYEVNPHWRFGETLENIEELQKKARKPTTG